MNTELDSLEVRVQDNAASAASGLDKLIGSLNQLKGATKGVTGLSRIASGLESLNKALSGLQVNKKGLGALRTELNGLSNVKTHLTATANQINKINAAMKGLEVDDTKLQKLVTSLNSLGQVQKAAGLTSVISALKQIPAITKSLSSQELQKFGLQIQLVTKYITPLATEMEKVSKGFAAFPIRIQKIIQGNGGLAASNKKAANSFSLFQNPLTNLVAKLTAYGYVLRRITSFLADSVMSINEYVENVNLFQVSMGDYYDEAFAYAQLVNEKLGIDPSQWMRTQGVFMSIASGFGVSREQAYALSEGLTELSYDLSSLYNEDVTSSAQRLQSALAGEIEPIRRLGISITEATLKEFALSKGIDESVESMTEQEKALLRTLKLMEGSATIGAIGDFARTLESPANALRVLKQQLTQLSRALGSVLIPILVQVLPYIQAFVELLTEAISALATLVGFTMPEWDTGSWGSEITTGADEATDAVGGVTDAVKELKNATLGIDELNILAPTGGGAGGGAAGGGGSDWANSLEVPDIWDQEAIAQISTKADEIKTAIEDNISKIFGVLGAAKFVVGAILALTGANIPTGLALMALGATELIAAAAVNWGDMDSDLAGVLSSLYSTLAGFLFVIGAVLVFSGANVPLGVGLMIAGAAGLAAAVSIGWNSLESPVANALTVISGVLGGALFAVGALFAFSGVNIPLGLGLMVAGAAVAASAVALNWSAMDAELRSSVSFITTLVSGALLALGAILTLSGANPVLGIALLAAGALALATTIAVNWGAMDSQLKGSITTVTLLASGALLALGAILTFSGANLPLGIGLMAAGAAGLITAAALNWDSIVTSVTETLKNVGHIVGISLIALGAILLLTGVGAPLGLGMIIAGGVSLVSAVALNWDSIVTSVSATLKNIGTKFLAFVDEWLSVDKWKELGKQAIDGLFKGLSNIWGNVKEWGSNLIGDVKDALGIHSPSVEFAAIGEYSVAGLLNGFDGITAVAELFKQQMSNVESDNATALKSMETNFADFASKSTNAVQMLIDALRAIPRNVSTTYTITRNVQGSTTGPAAYASGGFPDQGQLFLANEAGPELVGQMGRRTAVANNDQIVEGIAYGVSTANEPLITAVYAAAQQIIRAVEAGGDVYMDGYKVGQRTTASQNRQNRVYGKTLQNV